MPHFCDTAVPCQSVDAALARGLCSVAAFLIEHLSMAVTDLKGFNMWCFDIDVAPFEAILILNKYQHPGEAIEKVQICPVSSVDALMLVCRLGRLRRSLEKEKKWLCKTKLSGCAGSGCGSFRSLRSGFVISTASTRATHVVRVIPNPILFHSYCELYPAHLCNIAGCRLFAKVAPKSIRALKADR